MKSAAITRDAAEAGDGGAGLRADSLMQGMLLLFSFTVLQRGVGFVRGVLFCQWLSPEELGRWDLAFSFLMLAAPLAVLGLPGSFGRYVAFYRQQGRMRTFLLRVGLASAVLSAAAAVVLWLWGGWFAWVVFGDANEQPLMALLTLTLLAVIGFNFFTSLFTALRLTRVVSMMQFTNGILFAAVSLGLLLGWRTNVEAVVIGYLVACGANCVSALWTTRRVWQGEKLETEALPQTVFWSKLVPFAAWMWATNLLANLFDVADRTMIVHCGGFDADTATVLVGNYHSSRVVPMLMVQVAGMLSGLILPHLSHDWERGDRENVSRRLRLGLKLFGVTLLAGSLAVMIASPLLFGWMLDGKYAQGSEGLPMTLTMCAWLSLCLLAQNYLWCVEKPGWVSLVYAAGVAVNVGLNLILLPTWGLHGAVAATTAGMGVSLALVYWFNGRLGMRMDRGVLLAAAAPLSLSLGVWPALATCVVLTWAAVDRDWLFSPGERAQLMELLRNKLRRLPGAQRSAASEKQAD